VEIVNLSASILMAVSMIPYGIRLMRESPMDNSAPRL